MIFALSLFQTDGKTPALLVALRPDEGLYSQALKVFYQVNELDMRWQGGLSWFAELRREVKGTVRNVDFLQPAIPPLTLNFYSLFPTYKTQLATSHQIDDQSQAQNR